jgi:hypothetical protein
MAQADEPLDQSIAQAAERLERFDAWVEQLRRSDPAFAEASELYPSDCGEWQAAVYLLTACTDVWTRLRSRVLAERSIGPALGELETPLRAWSSSEEAVMRWALHFWDINRHAARFPDSFEGFYFHRWITALHLRRRMLPALTVSQEAR